MFADDEYQKGKTETSQNKLNFGHLIEHIAIRRG